MANIDLEKFLDFLYADTSGWVYAPIKKRSQRLSKELWDQSFFKWPDERSSLVKYIETQRNFHNVFVAPALFKSNESAEKDNVLGSWVAWADFDGDAPGTWEGNQPSLIIQSSGPSNQHVYFKFNEFCTDIETIEAANRQLVKSSGDASGWDANQVLRPVETPNRKRDEKTLELVYPSLPQVQAISPIGPSYAVQVIAYPSIAEVMAWAKEHILNTDKTRSDVFFGPLKDMVRDGVPEEVAIATAKVINATYMPDHIYSDKSIRSQLENAKRAVAKEPANPAFTGLTGEKAQRPGPKRKLTITKFSEIENQEQEWLYSKNGNHLVPLGEISILAGLPGAGKSTLLAHIIASITKGTLPGGRYGKPGFVLLHSTEDNYQRTTRPRLEAAGADMAMAAYINEPFKVPAHIDALAELIEEYKPALMVFDPIGSIMAKDSNNEDDVRELLDPLGRIAHHYNNGLIGVKHFKKEYTRDQGAVGGSIAWTAVPRSVIAVVNEGDKRVMGQLKTNLAPDSRPEQFSIAAAPLNINGKDTRIGTVEWLDETDNRDMVEVLANAIQRSKGYAPGEKSTGGRGNSLQATVWLREYMLDTDGWVMARDVTRDADEAGFSYKVINKALGSALKNERLKVEKAPSMWYDETIISREDALMKATESYAPPRFLSLGAGEE